MEQAILILLVILFTFSIGFFFGYLLRKVISRRKQGTIEEELNRRLEQSRKEREKRIEKAKQEAEKIVKEAEGVKQQAEIKAVQEREYFLRQTKDLNEKDVLLTKKEQQLINQEKEYRQWEEKLKQGKEKILQKLEEVSSLTEKEAKEELLKRVEQEAKQELLTRFRKLEAEGKERYQEKAMEITALAVQKYAPSQVEDLTTTTISLPNEDIKGRIIGKSGRNIRAFEKASGVELIIDEAPQTVVVSAFNPLRRRIAQVALEKLIDDGRIQPARIERVLEKAKEEVREQVKQAGEAAVYKVGLVDLPPKLVELLGRLRFRTSYGQNVLLHSIEVAMLAKTMAEEIGADSFIAKKAGLLHDIGKAVDEQIEGSHVEIGIKILEKFKVEPAVITAMKSHHEDYPYESVEAILVQTADAISGSRPGARRESSEEFLKRLEDLEEIAKSIEGVKDCYAIEAGREIRVLVKPEAVDDFQARKIAKEIVDRVQSDLTYPGEIKVNVIRESRIVEYAR
jgi:ribonucrease Y